MCTHVTAQLPWDGTFSSDAVATAGLALVARLHDEAMATIAALAEGRVQPAEDGAAQDGAAEDEEPVTYREPATWSVTDEDDEYAFEGDDEDEDDEDEVRVLPRVALPALLPRPRPAAPQVGVPDEQRSDADVLASAATDEFAVPAPGMRQLATV